MARIVVVFGEARPHHPYIEDLLVRLPTQPASRIEEMLPYLWQYSANR